MLNVEFFFEEIMNSQKFYIEICFVCWHRHSRMALPLQLGHEPHNLVISISLVTLDVNYSYELPLEEVKLILK